MDAPHTSLCMIVRNEQHNLPECLRSMRDLIAEVVIVDTGSSDQTKIIAASYGARVFDFPWRHDFAAARNESLRRASGEWIFWLDADERIDPINRKKLRVLFRNLRRTQVVYSMRCDTFARGTPAVAYHPRLFRSDSGGRWQYRVHETLDWPASTRPPVVQTDIAIQHIGYREEQISAEKNHRNLHLLEMEIQERPNDVHVLLHLARGYIGAGRFAEAVVLLEKCLKLAPVGSAYHLWTFYSLLQSCVHLSKWELALHYCVEGLKFFPNDPLLSSDGQKLAKKISSSPV